MDAINEKISDLTNQIKIEIDSENAKDGYKDVKPQIGKLWISKKRES